MCYNKNVKFFTFFGDEIMRIKSISVLLSLLFIFSVVFSAPVSVFAEENTWEFELEGLEHKSISFSLDGVDRAQNALLCIEFNKDNDIYGDGALRNADASEYIEIPFSITNTYQNFELSFPENQYLESNHYYDIIIKNEDNEVVYNSKNEGYVSYRVEPHDYDLRYFSGVSVFGKTGALIYVDKGPILNVSTTLNFEVYKGKRINENYFRIDYPEQKIGDLIEITLSDGYGCEKKYEEYIQNEFDEQYFEIENDEILRTSAKAVYNGYVYSDVRMCAEINGKTYYGEYTSEENDLKVSYPEVEAGEEIKIWFEGELKTKSEPKTYTVYDREGTIEVSYINSKRIEASFDSIDYFDEIKSAYIIFDGVKYNGKLDGYNRFVFDYKGKPGGKVSIYFTDNEGYVYTKEITVPSKHDEVNFRILKCNVKKTVVDFYCFNEGEENEVEVKSITLTANGKTYKMKGYSDNDDYYYKSTYSIKKGTTVTVKIVTKDGYTYTKTANAAAVKPVLSICPFYSGENKLYIYTVPKSKVNIKIGSKKYKGTADKNGYVIKKVKPKKSGTKIIVSVKDPTNCTNTKTAKVKSLWGQIYLKNKVYTYSSKVKIKVTKVIKNDKVKLTIGNKTYTKKVKKKEGSSTLTFKIKKPKAGSKIKIKYTDSFGKKKGYFFDDDKNSVFIGDKIYNGMSEKNCVLTSWGYPVVRNKYGSLKEWKFIRGGSYCWVYIQNGKVLKVHHYNY